MSSLTSLILVVLSILIGVSIHEFGHLIVAKLCGKEVLEYSIGMGPLLWKKDYKGTQYSLRAIPLGGFCSIPEAENTEKDDTWKDLAVILAGVVMNFLVCILTILVCLAVYSNGGKGILVVGASPEKCTLQPGDKIVSIDNHDVTFTRNDKTYTYTLTEEESREVKIVDLRYTVSFKHLEKLFKSIPIILKENGVAISKYFNADHLKNKEVDGTTVAALLKNSDKIMSDARVYPVFASFLRILFLLNISFVICNLIPIPCLDGGRAVLILFNIITFNKVGKKFQKALIGVSFLLIFGLLSYMMVIDILIA